MRAANFDLMPAMDMLVLPLLLVIVVSVSSLDGGTKIGSLLLSFLHVGWSPDGVKVK